jgi:hypothetical protein
MNTAIATRLPLGELMMPTSLVAVPMPRTSGLEPVLWASDQSCSLPCSLDYVMKRSAHRGVVVARMQITSQLYVVREAVGECQFLLYTEVAD